MRTRMGMRMSVAWLGSERHGKRVNNNNTTRVRCIHVLDLNRENTVLDTVYSFTNVSTVSSI